LAAAAVGAASILAIGTYVLVALVRLRYPFELQWMEGGAVEHVRRLLAGQPLYVRPSPAFVVYGYPPLYFLVSAAVAAITGVGFLPLRLVSLTSSLGTMALIAALVRRETGRWLPGLVATGLFAAAYRAGGAWYDVGRVDSLFVFLLVAAIMVARFCTTGRGGAAAGLLLALAALTKQSAVLAALPVLGYLVVTRRKVGLVAMAGFVLPLALAVAALDLMSSGWFHFAVVNVFLGHPVDGHALLGFFTRDLGRHAGVAIVTVVGTLVYARCSRAPRLGPGPPVGYYAAAAAGLVGTAFVSRAHSGGYTDVLIPAYAALAVLFGLAVARLADLTPRPAWGRIVVAGACLSQLALLAYVPSDQVPSAADRATGGRFLTALRAVPGDVYVVAHPGYAVAVGKPAHAQAAAITDIVRGRPGAVRRRLESEIAEAVHQQRFAAIVFDGVEGKAGFPTDLASFYRPGRDPLDGLPGFRPVTDLAVRPDEWWWPVPAG